ncbi:hypothetical protein BpHYR1_049158 [Brachionus plicatilis]|uniref:Uncharacterized protein n=1 Tax=Brachionus plicatilis TaxID=10195 RepID=A0A3M7QRX9_BRAPC|nr:hypothetical protein BpHYR1_049158 [Brachionus plicatilis]
MLVGQVGKGIDQLGSERRDLEIGVEWGAVGEQRVLVLIVAKEVVVVEVELRLVGERCGRNGTCI